MTPLQARVARMFQARGVWESLWDTTYRFICPERNAVFRRDRSPNEAQSEVFDATGIDSAERLVNLVLAGLIPPWQQWMRFRPGRAVKGAQRERARAALHEVQAQVEAALQGSGFYEEMQPMLLDRTVGGTGALEWRRVGDRLRFRCLPLADVAIEEDYSGRVSAIAYRCEWSLMDLRRVYGADRLPPELRGLTDEHSMHKCVALSAVEADGQWRYTFMLDNSAGTVLETTVTRHSRMLATRWSKLPGTPYGRGPGLRALSDVRALNKLKELTLKNAAKAVAGVYTAINDGVLNPYTVSFEPGAVIPVGSNSVNEPSLRELPVTARFDVSQFSMEELRSSIKSTFLADQFGDLARTPRSATEVAERSRILAQDLGTTIARLQGEIIAPVINVVIDFLEQTRRIEPMPPIDGLTVDVEFLGRLAQAQLMSDVENLIQYAQVVTEFGQIDPKAGLVLDVHKALRRVGELKGIHPEDMRTEQEIEDLLAEAAESQAQEDAMMQSRAGLTAPGPGAGL